MPLILWHIALLLRRRCQPCVFFGVYCSFWCDGNRVELFVGVVTGFCDNDNLFGSRGSRGKVEHSLTLYSWKRICTAPTFGKLRTKSSHPDDGAENRHVIVAVG